MIDYSFPKHIIAIVVMVLITSNSYSQQWKLSSSYEARNDRSYIPQKSLTFSTDFHAFQYLLSHAPKRYSDQKELIISLPTPIGIEKFIIERSDVLHPELGRKYPMIQSYTGQSLCDATSVLKLSLSHKGISATVFSQQYKTYHIESQNNRNINQVAVFYKDAVQKKDNFHCESLDLHAELSHIVTPRNATCQFLKYRLALACTGEYATYHGGSIEDVLAQYNVAINKVNGVYEIDLGITFELIPDTDQLIFLDPILDPYTNDSGSKMLNENQNTIDVVIGSENYDIGHVFSTGGGGIATIRSVCKTNSKAKGVTGLANPDGDPFHIDYVCHEIGHQFGCTHTFNNDCGSNQQAPATAYEPGSGSTIMGYAGVCEPNIQNNSDPYFHLASIQQVFSTIESTGNCAETINVGNNIPNLTPLRNDTLILPINTPFALTATASDMDGDTISYCWEQINNEIADMPPLNDAIQGPVFRSYPPTINSTRYFPRISSILTGANGSKWERLPTVDRDMTFGVVVRDNHDEGGCTANDFMTIRFSDESGPFYISNLNVSGIVWTSGTEQELKWEVAGTDDAPIFCETVSILLSINGGDTFDYTLASDAPNSGTAIVQVPNISSSQCRIIIKANDHIFFDINNRNFKIKNELAANASVDKHNACNGDMMGQITVNASGGSMPYRFSLDGENFQSSNTFSGLAGGSYQITVLDNTNNQLTLNNIIINEPEPLTYTAQVENGFVNILVDGGVFPYLYSNDNGTSFHPNNVFQLLIGQSYNIIIQDGNGCIIETEEFSDNSITNINIETTDVACFGELTGKIEIIDVTGGIPPYSYTINDNPFSNQQIFTSLSAGIYEVKVKDSEGFELVKNLTITEPESPLSVEGAIDENNLTITANGGTMPYVYSIDGENFGTVFFFGNLADGNYTGTVKDANGCAESTSGLIINTSTYEPHKSGVIFYPNPASERLYGNHKKELQFTLINIRGQKIQEDVWKVGRAIDVSHIKNGIYLLKFSINDKEYIHKIYIQK